MIRQEVYDKCVERIAQEPLHSFKVAENGTLKMIDGGKPTWLVRELLPTEAIDAIIDCAVEEAVKAMKEKVE